MSKTKTTERLSTVDSNREAELGPRCSIDGLALDSGAADNPGMMIAGVDSTGGIRFDAATRDDSNTECESPKTSKASVVDC